ncbi:hypothetical protein CAEBREN_15083 [Caenorhabditis brenneri]|uniref:Uncharacterized protein n=1 Tax=Caenorhabditis brenneri TaxID=135651 RepID=G0NQT7_CAEBE|nr:hypothetical protein CAEBREN_15083 [Caenorhabditis brenneri]
MLPGVVRPIALPSVFAPLEPGYVDINLSSLFLMHGRIEHVSIPQIHDMNRYLQDLKPVMMWNSCNGYLINPGSELSLDATPISHHFFTKSARSQPNRRSTSVKRYFENKYKIQLGYSHSPLLRDPSGAMFPIETVWIRFRPR